MSAKCRSSIGQVSAKCRRGIGALKKYVGRHRCRPTVDRQAIDYRSSVKRVSVDWRSSVDRVATEFRSRIDRVSTATSTDIAVDIDYIAVDITYNNHDPRIISYPKIWTSWFNRLSSSLVSLIAKISIDLSASGILNSSMCLVKLVILSEANLKPRSRGRNEKESSREISLQH